MKWPRPIPARTRRWGSGTRWHLDKPNSTEPALSERGSMAGVFRSTPSALRPSDPCASKPRGIPTGLWRGILPVSTPCGRVCEPRAQRLASW